MKKKFLSLMMAAAVVATTSVSAFADEHQLTAAEEEKNVEVGIEGKVEDNNGNVLPSTVTVTVPTSLNFTVKKDGTVVSPEIEIKNSGNDPVSVIATEFIDTTGDSGIKVIKDNEPANRNEVKLRLVGGNQDITLTSDANDTNKTAGKMYNNKNEAINSSDGILLKSITAGNSLKLKIAGNGKATQPGDQPVNDTFKLKLKFKKER